MYPAANYYYSYPYPHHARPSDMPPTPLYHYHPWPYSYPLPHAPYPFPGTYHVPPPHYHHCCGCTHPPSPREDPQVDDNKTSNDSSLVPNLLLKDHPVMLLPRSYIANAEPEAKQKEKEMHSHEPPKHGGNGEMRCDPEYPILWVPRGYMANTVSEAKEKEKRSHEPVSVSHIEPSRQGEMAHDEKKEDGNRLPFKIFWLPSKNDQVGNDTKENYHDLVANKAEGSEGEGETSKKHVVQKVIPVKQASTKEEKKNPKSIETKANTGSVEKSEDGSRASPKASKLPPVCLRVDPLPRKKKSSRSPSPTAEKQRSNGSPVNTPKSSHQEAQVFKKSKEEEGEDNFTDNVAAGKGDESEKGKVEEKKKSLSEDEAALMIQSVYRGFEVRKSQPLKKLWQICEVQKQVLELRKRIQELETSSSGNRNRVDGKKEVIIGETIMSLLLNLDTIQGLHPFVREVRKSVTKELVGLQERLDSLVKSEIPRDQQMMHPEDDQAQLEMHKEKLNQAPRECDETHQVEALESREGSNELQLELHKEKLNQAPGECNEALETRATESQVELHKEEKPTELCDKDPESFEKPTECECDEAVGLCEKLGECDNALDSCDDALESCVVVADDKTSISIMEMKSAAKASDGTNEKAMEELMNKQLSVIRELTERVKDLEKKLAKKQKKKKIKVNKWRRSRDYVVEQQD